LRPSLVEFDCPPWQEKASQRMPFFVTKHLSLNAMDALITAFESFEKSGVS